ncbi:hypothetical protein [Hymenobacter jeollabukensis]|uniref:Uncharacterized protein n=1 Tax=Hymenobacter jeollabukensis TaxID=2025313 RepID=A0A5R8WIA3_9BACT|nr:hypothetical protein [Hymenobacter jeollabukensis]TLM88364.1 hypothetical protein FDY95_24605 [Hymenobacter jeollabukensis]
MTPDPAASDSIPNEADEAAARRSEQPVDHGTGSDESAPVITQGHMGDGSGQRGSYGDSDQTNGMEGNREQPKPE